MTEGMAYGLTSREVGLLGLVADGRTDKEIAKEMGLKFSTVNNYMKNIREKMGAASRAQACVLAMRAGLLK